MIEVNIKIKKSRGPSHGARFLHILGAIELVIIEIVLYSSPF
jgi:hypothetical protein